MTTRRTFLGGLAAASLAPTALAVAPARFDVRAFDRARVLRDAARYLGEAPATTVAVHSDRSAGGLHDFFSEGDYWWPDPADPNGPYIQHDGETNPHNFTAHREYLLRLSIQMPALTSAWVLTGERRYADHALAHVRAWFVDAATLMNPNLQYAQAIHGITTGRGRGVIDTIHLVEIVRAIEVLCDAHLVPGADLAAIMSWFAQYADWLATSPNGIDERDATNNHTTCWTMQLASFAGFAGNAALVAAARERLTTVLVPKQMAPDGSFPRELERTKPYGYSLFNLEAMATLVQLLSTPQDDLWQWTLSDGRGMARAMAFMEPYIADKHRWPRKPDVMYDALWPMRQASLYFAGIAYGRADYLDVWKRLPAESDVEEANRNFFIRQPVLWS